MIDAVAGLDNAGAVAVLRTAVVAAGGYKAWGGPRGISGAELSLTLGGARLMTARIALLVGLRREHRYFPARRM